MIAEALALADGSYRKRVRSEQAWILDALAARAGRRR
jgi:hypothetical protein